ncbi:helix-turn-helix domain-containing protein [Kitasatospora cineracea]|uniref:Helix-turn-helix protein n=1 Tax=Kitasatospora cineracea TaxID=88074 RepID=A0A3N4R2H8_9ACTN|nr:helix-turn-helix transcriptional regulator [Kitasatospora cineracea]ROR35665.1 helix-turn-helix protein [Kitasatospora cineracea]RPE27753.1 helix-turn-helix protein [Kitasatospora cineracea]
MLGAPNPVELPDGGSRQEFGALLRHWRRHAGWTQAQLGAAVGYDHTAVSRLEHGARRATPRLVRQLDELLGSSGELTRCHARAESAEGDRPALPPHLLRPPLPPGAGPVPAADPADPCPATLPDHDVQCPLHGATGCHLPPPATALALHAAFCADPAAPLDTDTVHALAAVLGAQLHSAERALRERAVGERGPGTVIEGTLRAVVARLADAPTRHRRVLARLAAEYSHAAGSLRLHGGRPATAMACFDRALGWAALAGDATTQAAALSDMAVLGLLDDDPAAAGDYAREIRRAAPGRPWSDALATLGEARATALAGDIRATVRHIGRARQHLDRPATVGTEDHVPWLAPAALRLRVESGSSAALRDLAAATADPRLAHRALTAATAALDLLGDGRLPAARTMLTVRAADCHLCADDPHTALATLAPVLDGAPLPALVRHELRGLRDRLTAGADRWGPAATEAAARLGAAI